MDNFILIFLCLIFGIVLRKTKSSPAESYKLLNSIIINISLPALALLYIPQINISSQTIYPLISMWLVFISAFIFFYFISILFKYDKKTTGSFIMTAGLCNTSFVGFPILISFFGTEALKTGIIIDQAGSFVILATFGVIISSVYSCNTFTFKKIFYDILKYPPFFAFIVAIILKISGYTHPLFIETILSKLGGLITILALISIGLQLKLSLKNILYSKLLLGLFFKLIIAPGLIFFIYYFLAEQRGLVIDVSLIESAMPPMVMGSVMAVSYGLNKELANQMVGIGIPLSFLTLPFWYYLINQIK